MIVSSEVAGLRSSEDVLKVRRAARALAVRAGFGLVDQTKIVTAVSELARNTVTHGGGGDATLELLEEGSRRGVRFSFRDQGPGIADVELALRNGYSTCCGLGLGLGGSRRLMGEFDSFTAPGKGTTVLLGKTIPVDAPVATPALVGRISAELASRSPGDPFEEIQQQNQELLRTMDELRLRQEGLSSLNRELEDTNRGMSARSEAPSARCGGCSGRCSSVRP